MSGPWVNAPLAASFDKQGRLWFVEKNGDKAGQKFLVDSNYAEGGNVEHQLNGLLRGLDNWIYNAKSSNLYRRVGKNK